MVIIKLFGGLGNQMFQYGLYTRLKSQNREVLLDSQFIDDDDHNYHKSSIFRSFDISKNTDINFRDAKTSGDIGLLKKTLEKFQNDEISYYIQPIDWGFDENILKMDNVYADGYWQSERYFRDCEEQVRNALRFRIDLVGDNKEICKRIEEAQYPVSIHVREGDYNDPVNQRVFGKICTDDYYNSAVRYFEERHSECSFFVFSNDIKAARKRLGNRPAVYVDGNSEADGSIDMFLMSRCRGHIIANSSFSWWGAWINDRKDKEIVSPAVWSREGVCKDILLDSFIKIRSDGIRE